MLASILIRHLYIIPISLQSCCLSPFLRDMNRSGMSRDTSGMMRGGKYENTVNPMHRVLLYCVIIDTVSVCVYSLLEAGRRGSGKEGGRNGGREEEWEEA